MDEYLQIRIKLSDFELEESATYDISNLLQSALPADLGLITSNEILDGYRIIQIDASKIADTILLIGGILKSESFPPGSYMLVYSQGRETKVDLEREIDAYIDT